MYQPYQLYPEIIQQIPWIYITFTNMSVASIVSVVNTKLPSKTKSACIPQFTQCENMTKEPDCVIKGILLVSSLNIISILMVNVPDY